MPPSNKISFRFQEVADPESLGLLGKILNSLGNILQAIQRFKVDLPNVFKVQGTVTVDSVIDMPPVEVRNLSELRPYFDNLAKGIGALQAEP